MASPAFAIQRITLPAGVSQAVQPMFGHDVTIGNGCATDLLVYSTDGDDRTYVAIAAGWDRTFRVSSFQTGLDVLWLKCSAGGTVTLIWT